MAGLTTKELKKLFYLNVVGYKDTNYLILALFLF